jgi:hypothetical protein
LGGGPAVCSVLCDVFGKCYGLWETEGYANVVFVGGDVPDDVPFVGGVEGASQGGFYAVYDICSITTRLLQHCADYDFQGGIKAEGLREL